MLSKSFERSHLPTSTNNQSLISKGEPVPKLWDIFKEECFCSETAFQRFTLWYYCRTGNSILVIVGSLELECETQFLILIQKASSRKNGPQKCLSFVLCKYLNVKTTLLEINFPVCMSHKQNKI